jgi:hypothetical protein
VDVKVVVKEIADISVVGDVWIPVDGEVVDTEWEADFVIAFKVSLGGGEAVNEPRLVVSFCNSVLKKVLSIDERPPFVFIGTFRQD